MRATRGARAHVVAVGVDPLEFSRVGVKHHLARNPAASPGTRQMGTRWARHVLDTEAHRKELMDGAHSII